MSNKKAAIEIDQEINSGFKKLSSKHSTREVSQSQAKKIRFSNIPEELCDLSQWYLWRYKIEEGKKKKPPCDFGGTLIREWETGKYCKTLVDRIEEWKKNKQIASSKIEGVGILFTEDDPYFGIDVDDCFEEDGSLKGGFQWILDFNTYTEISPSGDGLRIIGRVKDKSKYPIAFTGMEPTLGIYTSKKFFTITGNVYEGHSQINDCTEIFETTIEVIFKQCLNEQPTKIIPSNTSSKILSHKVEVLSNDIYTKPIPVEKLKTYPDIWRFAILRFEEESVPNSSGHKSDATCRSGGSKTTHFADKINNKIICNAKRCDEREILERYSIEDDLVNAYDKLEAKKTKNKITVEDLELTTLDDISDDDLEMKYLINELLPENTVTILAGGGGTGKSSVALAIAAAITKGSGFPIVEREPGNVLLFAMEDPGKEMKKRFKAQVGILSSCVVKRKRYDFSDEEGLTLLKYLIAQCKPILVILDTGWDYRGKYDLNTRTGANDFIANFRQIAEDYHTSFLILFHYNGDDRSGINVSRVAGSRGLVDYGKSVLLIQEDVNDREHKFICQDKVNYSKRGKTLEYRTDGENGFEWIGYLKGNLNRHPLQDAADFALNLLKDKDMLSNDHTKICRETLLLSVNEMRTVRKLAGISKELKTVYQNKFNHFCLRHPDKAKRLQKEAEERAKRALDQRNEIQKKVVNINTKKFS